MSENPFLSSLDIGNRGLQHLGVPRIVAFTDDSKEAAAVLFAYDKVRQAELRRNNWRFSIRRCALRPVDTDTMLVSPALWSATASYQPGSIVQDAQGVNWISTLPFNLNRSPGSDPAWDVYFGPLTAEPFDSGTGYFVGEFVYENPAPGVFNIFSALQTTTSTSVDPSTPTAWSGATLYAKGQVVQYTDGFYYMSLIARNLANTPATYVMWNVAGSYAQNTIVSGSDGLLYLSMVNSNVGNDPTTDNGAHWLSTGGLQPWTPQFMGSLAGNGWVRQAATLVDPNIIYPLGSGPSSESTTRNIFRLPNGFLRRAPQDPKSGSNSFLGAPIGYTYDDWLLEGNYIVSGVSTPILLRFAADITLVTAMDPMFCEGLAARLGMELCEELTQSAEKLKAVAAIYKLVMSEARTVNGIETGSVEPPEDSYITVRR